MQRERPARAIEEFRRQIEVADRALLAALRARVALAEQLLRYKEERGLTLFDPGQEERVLDRIGSWAAVERVEPALARAVMRLVIEAGKLRHNAPDPP
jgi:chorismate mutase